MASNYTNLGIQLMTTGEKAGEWGTLTNTNWNIIEQIAGGYTTQALTDNGTLTLSKNDGTTGATLATRIIKLTGTLSAGNSIVTVPDSIENWWLVNNAEGGSTYTVTFKTVSGTGVEWAAGETGFKFLYTDGTNVVDVGFATLTGTETLTNKTLTSPKIGTSILDTNGLELMKLTATGSATNEFTVANAATGAGPTLSSTGSSDSNIDINVTPAGTGNVNLSADTVRVGDNNANATITTDGTGDLTLNTNAGTNSGSILIADGANGDITITPDGTGVAKAVDAADATGAIKIAGKETMWVPASAMYATTTNGAEAAQAELTATNPELKTFAFDTTTAEYTQFNVSMPKTWNLGTVTFQTFWSASGTDTGTGGFKMQGVSIANNVDYDTSFGTAVANTALAASGTQDDLMVNVESGAVTIASAAVDCNTVFQMVRDVSTDTNTGDLRLVGVKIFYTTNAANDA